MRFLVALITCVLICVVACNKVDEVGTDRGDGAYIMKNYDISFVVHRSVISKTNLPFKMINLLFTPIATDDEYIEKLRSYILIDLHSVYRITPENAEFVTMRVYFHPDTGFIIPASDIFKLCYNRHNISCKIINKTTKRTLTLVEVQDKEAKNCFETTPLNIGILVFFVVVALIVVSEAIRTFVKFCQSKFGYRKL